MKGRLSRVWRRAFNRLPGRRGIYVYSQGMLGSQEPKNCRSALSHHYLSNVTRLHHEEVAESDFAAQIQRQ
jgi:hypothetical protein